MAFQDLATQGIPVWVLIIVIIWTLIWKGLALWKSAKNSQKIWFVILLVVNTFGILEILYIFLFSKIKFSPKSSDSKRKKKSPKRKTK